MRRSWLIPAVTAVLFVAGSAPARAGQAKPPDYAVGVLVNHPCYLIFGAPTPNNQAELDKCSIPGAQRGDRLAVLNSTGLFLVKGPLTQNDNAKLIPLINKPIRLNGVVTTQDLTVVAPVVETETDTRRMPLRTSPVIPDFGRKGDFREGDPKTGTVRFIEATSGVDLTTKKTFS
jgi:hypothetical protein